MRTPMLFYMLLGISLYFPNEVTPLPQEHPLLWQDYGAECGCVDGTSCGGACSCTCSTGTCIVFSLPVEPPVIDSDMEHCEDPKDGFWCHCGPCPDGSTCQGKNSCHCDKKTGACEAFNDCGNTTTTTDGPDPVTTTTTDDPEPVTTTTTDVPEPVTTTTTDVPEPVTTTNTDDPEPVTTTTDVPEPVTTTTDDKDRVTTTREDSCEGCEECCIWPPPGTSICQDCWTHSCCNSTTSA